MTNPFNTPPTPGLWLPAAKAKPGRITSLTHFQAAVQMQRRRWRNQVGQPPVQRSRAGLRWEAWELAWLQDPLAPSVQVLATWTGRTAAEIHEQFDVIDGLPEKKTEFVTPTKETTMGRSLSITDEQITEGYEKYYIGRSERASLTADHLGISEGSFTGRCKRLGLRLRTKKEGHAAKNQPGVRWLWLDEGAADSQTPLTKPRPKPKTPALKLAPAEPTPEPPAEPEPEPPAEPTPERDLVPADPGPGYRAIVVSSQPYPPAVSQNGYHSEALGDLARLVRDLTAAGADVAIRLNVDLEVRP